MTSLTETKFDSSKMEDFIPVYPDDRLPDIQRILSVKEEFKEMASTLREQTPIKGELYLNQKLFIRYMVAYDRILNISETGVGKSCQIIGLREHLKKTGHHIKRCYILQKPATIPQFKDQIVYKCTNNVYDNENIKNAKTDKSKKSNITKSINKWYTLMTYNQFANKIINNAYTDEQIIEEFSDCLFVIDEAHVLRNEGKKGSEKGLSMTYKQIKRVIHLIKRSKVVISTATPLINGVTDFSKIANLALPPDRQLPEHWDYEKITLKQLEPFLRNHIFYMRALETGAIIEYQGNPITDKNGETFKYKVNYPLPEEELNSLIIDPYTITKDSKQPDVETYVKDVSSKIILYNLIMGDIQESAYSKIPETLSEQGKLNLLELVNEDDEYMEVDDGGKRFYSNSRQASAFVFPDGSFGGSFSRIGGLSKKSDYGISKYVTSNSPNVYLATQEFKDIIKNPKNLKRLSCKYYSIISKEISSPGVGYAYTDIVSGSGGIVLGLCLEQYKCKVKLDGMGKPSELYDKYFTRYNESSSIFTSLDDDGPKKDFLDVINGPSRIRVGFNKAPRYAFINGETPTNIRESILEILTSPENIDGEYIKFIMVSPLGREGLNIYHALRGHLITAGWHNSGMHQALSRIKRSVSHDDLVKRQMYLDKAKNISDIIIYIKIYKHCAFPTNPDNHSVDLKFYQHAELKSIPNHRLMRFFKQIDIGCNINRARNIKDDSFNYSEVCDYDICNYVCSADSIIDDNGMPIVNKEYEVDFSTYDILYSEPIINSCIIEITRVLKYRGVVTFSELITGWVLTGKFREKFIYLAIDRLTSNKTQLMDRFGFIVYVMTDGVNIYTQRDFPIVTLSNNKFSNLYGYSNNLYAIDHTDITTQSGNQNFSIYDDLITRIKSITDFRSPQVVTQFKSMLEQISLKFKTKLLEDSYLDFIINRNKAKACSIAILQRYNIYIHNFYEPVDDNQNAKDRLSKGESISGNRKIANRGITRPDFNFIGSNKLDLNGNPTEMIYIHSLDILDSSNNLTSYDSISTFTNVNANIRIYKPSENRGFRDVNAYEKLAYNDLLQKKIYKILDKFKKYEYFGSELVDGKFRIHDWENLKSSSSTSNTVGRDVRFNNKGRVCLSKNIDLLIEILGVNMIPIPRGYNVSIDHLSIDQIKNSIVSVYQSFSNKFESKSYTDKQIRFMYVWILYKDKKKDYICEVIKTYMINNDLLLSESKPITGM